MRKTAATHPPNLARVALVAALCARRCCAIARRRSFSSAARAPPPATRPTRSAHWSAPVAWPLVAVHMSLMPTGDVFMLDGFDAAPNSERIWDPDDGHVHAGPVRAQPLLRRARPARRRPDADRRRPHHGRRRPRGHDALRRARRTRTSAAPDMTVGALVPDCDRAAGRPRARLLRRQHRPGPARAPTRRSTTPPSTRCPRSTTRRRTPGPTSPARQLTSPLYPFMFVALGRPRLRRRPRHDDADPRPGHVRRGRRSATSPFDGMSAVMYRPEQDHEVRHLGRPRLQRRSAYDTNGRTAVLDMNAADARVARDGADGATAARTTT